MHSPLTLFWVFADTLYTLRRGAADIRSQTLTSGHDTTRELSPPYQVPAPTDHGAAALVPRAAQDWKAAYGQLHTKWSLFQRSRKSFYRLCGRHMVFMMVLWLLVGMGVVLCAWQHTVLATYRPSKGTLYKGAVEVSLVRDEDGDYDEVFTPSVVYSYTAGNPPRRYMSTAVFPFAAPLRAFTRQECEHIVLTCMGRAPTDKGQSSPATFHPPSSHPKDAVCPAITGPPWVPPTTCPAHAPLYNHVSHGAQTPVDVVVYVSPWDPSLSFLYPSVSFDVYYLVLWPLGFLCLQIALVASVERTTTKHSALHHRVHVPVVSRWMHELVDTREVDPHTGVWLATLALSSFHVFATGSLLHYAYLYARYGGVSSNSLWEAGVADFLLERALTMDAVSVVVTQGLGYVAWNMLWSNLPQSRVFKEVRLYSARRPFLTRQRPQVGDGADGVGPVAGEGDLNPLTVLTRFKPDVRADVTSQTVKLTRYEVRIDPDDEDGVTRISTPRFTHMFPVVLQPNRSSSEEGSEVVGNVSVELPHTQPASSLDRSSLPFVVWYAEVKTTVSTRGTGPGEVTHTKEVCILVT